MKRSDMGLGSRSPRSWASFRRTPSSTRLSTYLQLHSFDRATVLERNVRAVDAAVPAAESLGSFTQRMSARTPTPGGGSAAAAAGALAAALGEMVLAYSIDPAKPDPELPEVHATLEQARVRFLTLVDEDSRSYELVRSARKTRKATPGPEAEQAYVEALRTAARVPLDTARLATSLAVRLRAVQARTRKALASDLVTALALFRAATEGALANVEINLLDLKAAGIGTTELEGEVQGLRAGWA